MGKTISRAAVSAFALLLFSGCVTRPDIQLASSGTIPSTGGYAIADTVAPELERSFSAWAEARGLLMTEQPAYLVQVTLSERPATTGLFLPDQDASEWLRAPDLRRKRQSFTTLAISIAETSTGQEVFRASASRRGGHARAADLQPLLEAMLAEPSAEDDLAG